MNEVDVPDSSPSRPAKRRKKTEDLKSEHPVSNQLPLNPPAPEMDGPEARIAKVTQHLGHPVSYKTWCILVGRNTADGPDDDTQYKKVHIDLSPNKMISRNHADIFWNEDGWRLKVFGRNGVRVDNRTFRSNEVTELHSGAVIEIANIEMMFVLPSGELNIAPRYLRRAEGLAEEDADDLRRYKDTDADPDPIPDVFQLPSTNGSRGQNGAPQAIAPAPANYQRPGTPPASRIRGSTKRSPLGYSAGGTMVMNDAENIDLSLDSNCHIKPGYSYGQMIAQAIISTPGESLALSGIYSYIMAKYSYYRHQPPNGWQNSIRHNLSLNRSYEKTPRGKHEPGKGMKWAIKTECYDATRALAYAPACRGGHRGSSQPASPITASGRDIKDEFDPSSAIKGKRSPSSASPRMSSYASQGVQFTPDRAPRVQLLQEGYPGDGSPLPRHRRNQNNTIGLSDNIPGSPPILSSSYQQDEVLPSDQAKLCQLAPPPSFWKYAAEDPPPRGFGGYDSSPIKAFNAVLPSSSPPPMRRRVSAISPTRMGVSEKLEVSDVDELEEEEEQKFDLAKGFQSIGSYHAPVSNGAPRP
ncbi:hypothetical protein EYC84_007756 [Monilinia fructicola]|uniref:Fork-head domain-containing protein n=1 Tax=Monilinia fructicola TaxID=38448 RepID=A0A5M9JLS9_MONFR|nr:hypothetical protein EYC84_007756 [Monilinia fructicola]